MRFRQLVLGAVVALTMVSGAVAEDKGPTLGEFPALVESDAFYKGVFIGVARGIEVANFELGRTGSVSLYCPPKAMESMPWEQWVDILKKDLKNNPAMAELRSTILPTALLGAIKDVFPCP